MTTLLTRNEMDILWSRAIRYSVQNGEEFIRYHFADLIAKAERDACASMVEPLDESLADAIRERGQQ